MARKPGYQWPHTVEFRACPECHRHANFVIDGRKDETDVASTEGAMHRIADFVKQHRITFAQAHELIARVFAAELPATEAEALLFASIPGVAAGLALVGGGLAALFAFAGGLAEGEEADTKPRHSH